MSVKWSKSREGKLWYREYMRAYMRKRRKTLGSSSGREQAEPHAVIVQMEPVPVPECVAAEGHSAELSRSLARPARSVLSMVKPVDIWPADEKPAESISAQYQRQIRKPKEQKPLFSSDQIIR